MGQHRALLAALAGHALAGLRGAHAAIRRCGPDLRQTHELRFDRRFAGRFRQRHGSTIAREALSSRNCRPGYGGARGPENRFQHGGGASEVEHITEELRKNKNALGLADIRTLTACPWESRPRGTRQVRELKIPKDAARRSRPAGRSRTLRDRFRGTAQNRHAPRIDSRSQPLFTRKPARSTRDRTNHRRRVPAASAKERRSTFPEPRLAFAIWRT